MRPEDALDLARLSLEDHGLDAWEVKLDQATRRFGQCNHGTWTISLSRPLIEANEVDAVLDTIWHEVAHALAGPWHGHDHVWRAKCAITGARPERCYSTTGDNAVVAVTPRWRGTCQCEGRVFRRERLTRAVRLGGGCPTCKTLIQWERAR